MLSHKGAFQDAIYMHYVAATFGPGPNVPILKYIAYTCTSIDSSCHHPSNSQPQPN